MFLSISEGDKDGGIYAATMVYESMTATNALSRTFQEET